MTADEQIAAIESLAAVYRIVVDPPNPVDQTFPDGAVTLRNPTTGLDKIFSRTGLTTADTIGKAAAWAAWAQTEPM